MGQHFRSAVSTMTTVQMFCLFLYVANETDRAKVNCSPEQFTDSSMRLDTRGAYTRCEDGD